MKLIKILFIVLIILLTIYIICNKEHFAAQPNLFYEEELAKQLKSSIQNNNSMNGFIYDSPSKRPIASEFDYDKYFFELTKERPLSITYEDKLFTDVKTYENDETVDAGGYGRLGVDKCIQECKGSCVEFGVTGLTWCFPEKNIPPNYIENLRDASDKTENIDEKPDKLIYANMR